MRKLALIGMLALTGCESVPVEDIQARIKLVQEYAKLGCSFVPTAGMVATAISKNVSDEVQLATEICGAVTGPGKTKRVRNVTVKGSVVK